MKNKIIAIIIGLAFIIGLAVLGQMLNIDQIIIQPTDVTDIATQERIVELSGIEKGVNILTINEADAIAKIEKGFVGGNVEVLDIERVFPNKVIVHIGIRQPVLLISTQDGKVIPTDTDFQMTNTVDFADVNVANYVQVLGVNVENTLNLPELRFVKKVAYAFYALDFDRFGLISLVKSITFSEDKSTIALELRGYTGTVFQIAVAPNADSNTLISTINEKLSTFYALSEPERYGKTI